MNQIHEALPDQLGCRAGHHALERGVGMLHRATAVQHAAGVRREFEEFGEILVHGVGLVVWGPIPDPFAPRKQDAYRIRPEGAVKNL